MTTLKRGMVIDVDLNPTEGSETGKVRPCVIVTNNVYNERVVFAWEVTFNSTCLHWRGSALTPAVRSSLRSQ